MKTCILFVMLLCLTTQGRADELYFKSGMIIKNVLVTDTVGNDIWVRSGNERKSYALDDLLKVVKSPYDPTKPAVTENMTTPQRANLEDENSKLPPRDENGKPEKQYIQTYPNAKFLPLSLIAFGLSWDFFQQASDEQNAIDSLAGAPSTKVVNDLRDQLSSTKTRKTIIGAACLVVGLWNAYIGFSPVDVEATSDGVKVSYSF